MEWVLLCRVTKKPCRNAVVLQKFPLTVSQAAGAKFPELLVSMAHMGQDAEAHCLEVIENLLCSSDGALVLGRFF